MDTFEKMFCRLCLGEITGKRIEIVSEITEVLAVVLPNLNWNERDRHVMCDNCSLKLFAAFDFKAMCLDTEDCIFPYIKSEELSPVDLEVIYLNEKGGKLIGTEQKVCRMCMELSNGDFMDLKDFDQGMIICKYIPEVNFSITKHPVICKNCFDLLGSHCNFLTNCLNVQENKFNGGGPDNCYSAIKCEEIDIKFDVLDQISPTSWHQSEIEETVDSDNLESIGDKYQSTCEIKSLRNDIKSCYQSKRNLKLVCDEYNFQPKCRSSLIKCESMHNSASEEPTYKCNDCGYQAADCANHLVHHQVEHKDTSEVQLYKCNECNDQTKCRISLEEHLVIRETTSARLRYKCEECDLQTNRKYKFTTHQLTHRDTSEVQMYKCKNCDFETKYKASITTHQITHKDVSEVQMYKCKECDFQSKYRKSLSNHMVRHMDTSVMQVYKCEVCDFQTKRKSYLARHLLKHNDVSEVQM